MCFIWLKLGSELHVRQTAVTTVPPKIWTGGEHVFIVDVQQGAAIKGHDSSIR